MTKLARQPQRLMRTRTSGTPIIPPTRVPKRIAPLALPRPDRGNQRETAFIPLGSALANAVRRLLPFLFLLYVVSYLDRINVGFAALQMNAALGFSSVTYSLGAGIFFLGYTLLEIPSNVILARVGPRLWIARIMIT